MTDAASSLPLLLTGRHARRIGLAWAIVVLALSLWTALRVTDGGVLNGDLLALVPGAQRDAAAMAAVEAVQGRAERRLLLLLGAADASAAGTAAREIRDQLTGTGLLVSADAAEAVPDASMAELAFRHRWTLLSDDTRSRLAAGDIAGFERAVLRRYFGPGSLAGSHLVERDPLLLLPAFLEGRAGDIGQRFTLVDGQPALQHGGKTWVLVQAELTGSPFSFAVQDRLMPLISERKAELAAAREPVTLLAAGVLPHAAAGTQNARQEVSVIGTGSLLAVALLLIAAFRSPRPLLLCATAIGIGCLAGFAVTLALFGQVHLFTAVFAVSLIGTAVDYAIHYFATLFREDAAEWHPDAALAHVFPGISLGLVTTGIGFLGLSLSGFPGLMQIACFSVTGLAAAWATTLAWFPLLSRPRKPIAMGVLSKAADWWLARIAGPSPRRLEGWMFAALAVLAALGLLKAEPQDDVRAFQARDAAVMAEQAQVQAILGRSFASEFFLVQGRDAGELLAREEALGRQLSALEREKRLDGYMALSRFVPSPDRQMADRGLLQRAVASGSLDRISARLGLGEEIVERARADLASASPLTLRDWLAHSASTPFRHLWLGSATGDGVVASVVLLHGAPDPHLLATLDLPEGVRLLDPVGDISAVFATHRTQVSWLILTSFVMIAAVLMIRYGMAGGLRVLLVPAAAVLTCVALFGLVGGGFSFFHQVALLLVMGMGVDYGLFFRESGRAGRSTLMAVALSALTTILAFGLLAFSNTAAISAFGQTVFVGIATAFLISPLSKRPAGRATLAENDHVGQG